MEFPAKTGGEFPLFLSFDLDCEIGFGAVDQGSAPDWVAGEGGVDHVLPAETAAAEAEAGFEAGRRIAGGDDFEAGGGGRRAVFIVHNLRNGRPSDSNFRGPAVFLFRVDELDFFHPFQDLQRGDRQVHAAEAGGIVDRIGDRRSRRRNQALACFLGAEGAVGLVGVDMDRNPGRHILGTGDFII